jgi:hypothetical protein
MSFHPLLHRDIVGYLMQFIKNRSSFALVCTCWNRVWRTNVTVLVANRHEAVSIISRERFPSLKGFVFNAELADPGVVRVMASRFGAHLISLTMKNVQTNTLDLSSFANIEELRVGEESSNEVFYSDLRALVFIRLPSKVSLKKLSLLSQYGRNVSHVRLEVATAYNWGALTYLQVTSHMDLVQFGKSVFSSLETLCVVPHQTPACFSNNLLPELFKPFGDDLNIMFPVLKKLIMGKCGTSIIGGFSLPLSVTEVHLEHEPLMRGDVKKSADAEILLFCKRFNLSNVKEVHLYYNNRKLRDTDMIDFVRALPELTFRFEVHSGTPNWI